VSSRTDGVDSNETKTPAEIDRKELLRLISGSDSEDLLQTNNDELYNYKGISENEDYYVNEGLNENDDTNTDLVLAMRHKNTALQCQILLEIT